MKSRNKIRPSIQTLLRRSILIISLSFVFISVVTSALLAYQKTSKNQSSHWDTVSRTLLVLLSPALKMSNYMEVQRVLALVSQGDEFYGIITDHSDILLSDYARLPIVKKTMGDSAHPSSCTDLKNATVPYQNSIWGVQCREIDYNDQQIVNDPRPRGLLLGFSKSARLFAFLGADFKYILTLLIVALTATIFFLRRAVSKIITDPLDQLVAGISLQMGLSPDSKQELAELLDTPLEIDHLRVTFNELLASVKDQLKHRRNVERNQALLEQAAQVAHDVRSPLAALEVVSRDVAQLPEDKRIMIRSAVGRIRDIANSLLDRHRALGSDADSYQASVPAVASEASSPQLLSSLIDPVVSEKRLQFRSNTRVEIELRLDAPSYGLFAVLQPIEFKRSLSNLINNAVEAFGNASGAVSVCLSARDDRALVSVQDNGKGIEPGLLVKLGRRGQTHGKAEGSGLGLYHARISAESWGGSLELVSEVGKGTTATLVLPLVHAPEWFVSGLVLIPGEAVVILDDDASIHQVWQGRLDALRAREHAIEIVHVSTPEDIRSWVKGNDGKARETLYLMDYELLGYRETGLSLAEELGIGERAVLVTSRYEEPEVLEGCQRLKMRMIPKGLAGLVPIRIKNPALALGPAHERWDAVLIDDDPLTRMTWKMAASEAGNKFQSFSTVAEFLAEAPAISRETPVYVDAKLADGVNGAEESLRIHELGFLEIYLATGHEAAKFAAYKHLRGVVGKEPPWS